MSFHVAHIQDYNRFVAVDIGSYRVRAALYSLEDGDLTMLSYASVRQDKKNIINGSIVDMRSVALTIERAIMQVSRDIDNTPSDIILSFSSHATLSDIITTQYVRADKNAPITMSEIDSIINRIEAESFSRIREKAKREFGISHDDIRLVSSTITAISIDGKNFTNPLGSSGTHIRLTILNIFAPASDYNMIRSIISSLDKRIISLIPMPLVLPKLIEKSDHIWENTCSIDIGYSHTTVILESKNEILAFETFPIGTHSLLEIIGTRFPDYSPLQIERIIHDACLDNIIQKEIDEFLEYLIDAIIWCITQKYPDKIISNILLHWWLLQNTIQRQKFISIFHTSYGRSVRQIEYQKLNESLFEADSAIPYGLALMAQELLLVKKDPLVRILRYVLYNYE